MLRYNIRVNYGNNNLTKKFYFVHKDWETMSAEDQDKAFNDAVTELNRIYKDYGRFATQIGIVRLFEKYGFDETIL
ncbi:MAG: hypothetical protein IJZ79_03035 [Bacilli bacterium]|nr:hypothetical protein [Bacilli bacterium]MBQ8218701.1 hypothetical protein [Bacilli bacterium]